MSLNIFFLTHFFHLKSLPGKQSHSEILLLVRYYSYSLYIFNIGIRYSWILLKIFVNRNNIRQINTFANRNNNHELKLLANRNRNLLANRFVTNLFANYSQIFANRELFAEHSILLLQFLFWPINEEPLLLEWLLFQTAQEQNLIFSDHKIPNRSNKFWKVCTHMLFCCPP